MPARSPNGLPSPLADTPKLSDVLETVSLVLYGTCAIPVRLKILLDRLLASLPAADVKQVLGAFGWTYDDYLRGYIAQESGSMFDKWALVTREEEAVVLRQFLLFAETRALAQQFMAADNAIQAASDQNQDLKKLLEKSARAATLLNSHQQTRAVNDLILRKSPSSSPQPAAMKPKDTQSAAAAAAASSLASSVNSHKLKNHNSTVHRHDEQDSGNNVGEQNLPALFAAAAAAAAQQPSNQQNSPLNKLQSMQPYDYRTHKRNPNEERSESTPLSSPPLGGALQSFALNHSNSSDVSLMDDGMSSDDDDDELMSSRSSAMNLSAAAGGSTNNNEALMAQAKQLSRKSGDSSTSSKRRWDPMVLSTLTTNPSTGKRRVQCHVCLKTFCDKGALKIHFSAVHLREMHKCTVEGCNMMFSSRRSRNRHSANPNPKLHTPNLRRKISPHDGRTANPFPVLPPSALLAFNGTSPSHLGSVLQEGLLNSKFAAGLANGYPPNLLEQQDSSSGVPLSLIKSPQHLHHPSPSQSPLLEETGYDEEGMNLSMKSSSGNNSERGSISKPDIEIEAKVEAIDAQSQPLSLVKSDKPRKRKALNPTRVAVEQSDEEVRCPSTDNESSMNSMDHPRNMNRRQDSDEEDEDVGDVADNEDNDNEACNSDVSKDDFADSPAPPGTKRPKTEREFRASNERPWQLEVDMGVMGIMPTNEDESEHRGRSISHKRERYNGKSDLNCKQPTKIEMLDEIQTKQIKQEQQTILPSENPLRHLESLSMGAFTAGLLPAVRPGGVSFHAPGLGLADGPMKDEGRESPSNPADASQVNLAYRDAALAGMGSLEIPVDKENPRRCTACGKVFQNHFGVKTHYQNVHLKLMHKCTVEGCNAAFPSRRSRDRHSANLNLHRKLLSTSSITPGSEAIATGGANFGLDKMFPYGHPDFLSRFYDPQSLAEMYQRLPTAAAEASLLFPHSFGAFPHLLSQMPGLNPDRVSPVASGGSLHSRSSSPPSPPVIGDDARSESAPSSPAGQRASAPPAPSAAVQPTLEPLSLST